MQAEVADLRRGRGMRLLVLMPPCPGCARPLGVVPQGASVRCPCGASTAAPDGDGRRGAPRGRP